MPTRPKPLTPALLKKALKTNLLEADRIAVLGIGSDLRGDDAAGILVAQKLERTFAGSRRRNAAAFVGHTAPENLTGEIIRFIRGGRADARGHIVLVDTADMNSKPGAIRLLTREELGGVSFSTHQLPLSVLMDYLESSLNGRITVIGIQPAKLSFGAGISPRVRTAVNRVAAAIRSAVPRDRRARRIALRDVDRTCPVSGSPASHSSPPATESPKRPLTER
jgi:hydrogenase maturation protease HycI